MVQVGQWIDFTIFLVVISCYILTYGGFGGFEKPWLNCNYNVSG